MKKNEKTLDALSEISTILVIVLAVLLVIVVAATPFIPVWLGKTALISFVGAFVFWLIIFNVNIK